MVNEGLKSVITRPKKRWSVRKQMHSKAVERPLLSLDIVDHQLQ